MPGDAIRFAFCGEGISGVSYSYGDVIGDVWRGEAALVEEGNVGLGQEVFAWGDEVDKNLFILFNIHT